MIEKIETKFSENNGGHYVPAMKHNGVLYISGQLSVNPETGKVPDGGVKEEARQALKNLDIVLQSANTTKNDVIHCRVYIPDVAYWPEVNEVYAEYFGEHKPARTIVPSNSLHYGCLIEIDAVAACDKKQI